MSLAEQSRVYRFRDDVALTLHTRSPDGLDIRTAYIRPAHALLLACDLIRAAIDCAEQPEEGSACGTVGRVTNDCGNVAEAMGEVVQLIDQEAVARDHALMEECAGHLLHYQTMEHAHPDAARHAAAFREMVRKARGPEGSRSAFAWAEDEGGG